MKRLGQAFLNGFLAILPIVVTAYVLYWLGSLAEQSVGGLLKLALGEARYVRGMGIGVSLVLLVVLGFVMKAWVFRVVVDGLEDLLQRVPVVKTIYGSIRDLTRFLGGQDGEQLGRVVLVRVGGSEATILGFVTRDDFEGLPGPLQELGEEDRIAVYVQMSYQIGGFTFFVPRDWVEPVDLSIEEAMRFVMTAAMSTEKSPGSLASSAE